MRLSLPIFFKTDNEVELEGAGIEKKFYSKDADVKNMIFYNIDNIQPFEEDEKTFTLISSGHTNYICPLDVNEVDAMIIQSKYQLN